MTPWTPAPPEANHPSRRPRVPAIVNRACRGAVTAPAPRSAGRPPTTIAVPAPGGDPLDPRSAGHPPKKTPSPRPGTRQPCLPGAVTAPAPRSAGHSPKTIAVPASRRSSTVSAGPQSSLPWAFIPRTCVFFPLFNRFSWAKSHSRGRLSQAPHFSENAQKAPVALQGLFVACFTFEILFFFCFRLCECANAMPLRPSGPELHPYLHGRTRIM